MLFNLLSLAFLVAVQGQSKMIAEYAPAGRRLSESANSLRLEESRSAVFLQHCEPNSPVTFPLSAGEGKGFIGLMDNTDADVSLTISSGEGAGIHLEKAKEADLFSVINDYDHDGTVAMHFAYINVPSSGGEATITCNAPVTLMIAYKDHTDFALTYEVTTSKSGNDPNGATGSVHLIDQMAAKKLKATSFTKTTHGTRRLQESAAVDIHDESVSGVEFDSYEPGELVLVQVETEDPRTGHKVYRSIITETQMPPKEILPMVLELAEVDEAGDLHLFFKGLPSGYLLLKTLISVLINDKVMEDHIELKAMTDDGHLILHGGWIRKALDDAKRRNPTKGWKLIVTEAIALDPENAYVTVAEQTRENLASITLAKNDHLLSKAPSVEEKQISDDMKSGRPPTGVRRLGGRGLQGSHRKILVHGYCSSNPFPTNQFTNAIAFDSGSGKNNWSHDEFARRIRDFANTNGIVGCGIIAHSQGGAASLHLRTYYWSCLDNANQGGGRLIQSVGTPYRGTALAGNLASVGSVFGAGCGYNNDLTESGADAWLANIPSSVRSQVNYYTTSFTSNWWSYDYCQIATDPFLTDPDDGTVARDRAQLSGGINRGHKTGWCHSTSMRDPAQYFDSSRNSEMNNNARF